MRLVRVSVNLPEEIVKDLRRKKREGRIKSISEFLRNIIVYALEYGSITISKSMTIRVTETTKWELPRINRMDTQVGYGSHHMEIMQQLKQVLAKRKKK